MTTQMQHQSKKYKVILADPPWDVQQKGKHGAIKHYNLMTLDQIKSMPIADLADENSACVLWVTNATMEAGFDVLRAWGFKPTTSIFTYLKDRWKTRYDYPNFGTNPRKTKRRCGCFRPVFHSFCWN